MSKVIFDSAISLDGFFAGEDRSPSNPMGGISPKIHGWMHNPHYALANLLRLQTASKSVAMLHFSLSP
uniref:hypothetical protein n=1 Tax=Algoriphagus locisalis TaxID=305507 RepID=UPI000B87D59A|nr:hypothetical protein [Algoriphagus locisalis]